LKEFKLVTRRVNEIKPDPEQPRKEFEQEKIENLAKTIKSQGIINPIEIDENNVIITGEMRWRSAKKAGLEELECKLFKDMDKWERLERQTIENLHHNLLTSEERENVITELWNSGRYDTKQQLADILGVNQPNITFLTIGKKMREKHKEKLNFKISSKSLYDISTLPDSYQKNVITKLKKGEIKPSEVQTFVSSVKDMPMDIKTEILKPNSELSLEDAIEISEVQNPEMRKESIKFVKKQKQDQERTKRYITKIAKGETKPYTMVINLDEKFINQSLDLKKKIYIKWHKKNVESYNEHVQKRVVEIIKEIYEFLGIQLEKLGTKKHLIDRKVIEIDIKE